MNRRTPWWLQIPCHQTEQKFELTTSQDKAINLNCNMCLEIKPLKLSLSGQWVNLVITAQCPGYYSNHTYSAWKKSRGYQPLVSLFEGSYSYSDNKALGQEFSFSLAVWFSCIVCLSKSLLLIQHSNMFARIHWPLVDIAGILTLKISLYSTGWHGPFSITLS